MPLPVMLDEEPHGAGRPQPEVAVRQTAPAAGNRAPIPDRPTASTRAATRTAPPAMASPDSDSVHTQAGIPAMEGTV
ncbi:hypothetical protein GCM10009731_22540 [Streptomyces globosus]